MARSRRITRRRFVELSSLAAASALAAPKHAAGMISDPSATAPPSWHDAGVIDLRRSPYAKLHNVPVHAVTIRDGFWARRRTTNVNSSIPSMYDELIVHGRMTNFERLIGKSKEPQKGKYYS